MLNSMDDEIFDYEAAEDICDSLNSIPAPYQHEMDTQYNEKEDGEMKRELFGKMCVTVQFSIKRWRFCKQLE